MQDKGKLINVGITIHTKGGRTVRMGGGAFGITKGGGERAGYAERAGHADEADVAVQSRRALVADDLAETSHVLTRFLRKDVSDIAVEVITFVKGIIAKAVSYFSGIVNQGDLTNKGNMANSGNISNEGDLTNKGMISTKNLTVTGKATFFELEIQKAKAAGGMIVNSPSTFHIDAVEETADGWRCFQRAEQDGVVLMPMCEEGDQMMCANGMNVLKNGKGNRYYWRKVVLAMPAPVDFIINGKKEPCLRIDLSKTDRDPSSDDAPQVGDELVQVGSRTNKDRQGVIMTSAYKSFDAEIKAPYWAQYEGVNDYDLSKHRRTFFAHGKSAVYGDLMVKTGDGYVSQADVNTSTEKRFTTIEADAKGIRQAVADKATRTEVSQTADRLRQEVTNSERELRTTITQTADQIGLQISNGTHPNLLWGSDLTLEGVNVNDMQAVEQKIGVHVSCDKGFEYLSGQGVDGSDAMYFKCDPSKDLKFRGLYWEKLAGARKNIKVRRNTTYTISAWVRFTCSPAENSADYYLEAYATASADDTKRIRQYDMKWTAKPHSGREWKRVVCSFTSAEYDYISLAIVVHGLGVGELWVCRPKLELGEKATPWCEYDGTEEALEDTGIFLKDKTIRVRSDNFTIENSTGQQTFLLDKNGRINNGIMRSKFLLREPTIITDANWREYAIQEKMNGHTVYVLDLMKTGTSVVFNGRQVPSMSVRLGGVRHLTTKNAQEGTEALAMVGNVVTLYNINAGNVFLQGLFRQKEEEGVRRPESNEDEYGFNTNEDLPLRSTEFMALECRVGVTKPERENPYYYRKVGVFWEYSFGILT